MTESVRLEGGGCIRGEVSVPGDKSISHRALIFNAFASGSATIQGLLDSDDVRATARCLRQLGVQIEGDQVVGCGGVFSPPTKPLDCGNSGTTMRLLAGLLAGQEFSATLTGDASLCARPMSRVADPLRLMGARFTGTHKRAPLTITGPCVRNIRYHSPIASAQVKTAMMLAALQTEGLLVYEEPSRSRDHSERMLRSMGLLFVDDDGDNGTHQIRLHGAQKLSAMSFHVPGDISSAAFFLVAASIMDGSDLRIHGVGVNPSRIGILRVLDRMGANIELTNQAMCSGEPVADIRVRSAKLTGTIIQGAEIASLVDELPVLAIAAAHAEGPTVIRDAQELRVKESDRIDNAAKIITSMGGNVSTFTDGMTIEGRPEHGFEGFHMGADGDHRVAMTAFVAALAAKGESLLVGTDTIRTSFPGFVQSWEALRG